AGGPLISRAHRPAHYFRLTTCLVGPRARLRRTADYRNLLRQLNDQLQTGAVDLLSFCLVPGALHLVVAARGTRALDTLVSRVSTTRLRRASASADRVAPVATVVRELFSGRDVVNQCAFVERRAV